MARYEFELDQRSLIQVLVGLVVSLFLVFVAGVGVGLNLQLPEDIAADSSARQATQTQATSSSPSDSRESMSSSEGSSPDNSSAAANDRTSRGAQASSAASSPSGAGGSSQRFESDVSRTSEVRQPPGASDPEKASGSVPVSPKRAVAGDSGGVRRGTTSPGEITAPYTIQLGIFGNKRRAQELARRLRRDGHSPVIEPERRNGERLHQVWVGQYDTFSEAARHLSTFRRYVSGAFVARTD